MSSQDARVMRPSEAARDFGVPTIEVVRAMYHRQVVVVRLEDGTLGVTSDSLGVFLSSTAAAPMHRDDSGNGDRRRIRD